MNFKVDDYTNSPYFKVKNYIMNNHIDYINSFEDSLSDGQLKSKKWMIKELDKVCNFIHPVHVEIIGGWFGYPLIEMLESFLMLDKIDFYELDENCKKILYQYNTFFNLDIDISIFGDFFNRTELRRRHLIINTSAEHMNNISIMKHCYKTLPEPPLLVIQSNNYEKLNEHINCVNSEHELAEKNEIKDIMFAGSLEFSNYTRYMVIGKW